MRIDQKALDNEVNERARFLAELRTKHFVEIIEKQFGKEIGAEIFKRIKLTKKIKGVSLYSKIIDQCKIEEEDRIKYNINSIIKGIIN